MPMISTDSHAQMARSRRDRKGNPAGLSSVKETPHVSELRMGKSPINLTSPAAIHRCVALGDMAIHATACRWP